RQDEAGPVLLLGGTLGLARGRDPVVLGAAALGSLAPLAPGVALLLQPMKRGKERPRLHDERAARDLLDPIGDADAVPRLELQGLQDEEIERPLHQFRLALRHQAALYQISISHVYINDG